MNTKNTYIMHICWILSAVEHICILYRKYIWDIYKLYTEHMTYIGSIYVQHICYIYISDIK